MISVPLVDAQLSLYILSLYLSLNFIEKYLRIKSHNIVISIIEYHLILGFRTMKYQQEYIFTVVNLIEG